MAYVPGTPGTLSGMSATGLRRIAWEKKLRKDSIRPSVFESLKSAIKVVDDVVNIVKTGIFMEVENMKGDSGQSVRVAMRKPLHKAPQYGTANAVLGNEDEQDLLWTELYYNEIKKGVKYKRFGYDFNDTKYLNWVETQAESITDFMAELRDTRIHQALVLTYADELTYAPISASQQFNKNWCIPNLAQSSYPAWDKDSLTVVDGSLDSDNYYSSRYFQGGTTFVENIADALLSGSGVGSTPNATFTVDFLAQLNHYLIDELLMETIKLDGIDSLIILVHSYVWDWAMNPTNSGGIGDYVKSVADYKDPKRVDIPQEMGRYGSLVFVKDHRAPTLVVGGDNGSYTLRVNLCNPGNNDDRNKAAWSNTSGSCNYAFDLCFALGANAVAEYVHDPLVSDLFERTEYGQIEGRAAYLGSGIQIPAFDKDTASRLDGTSTTQIQRGSCVIPVAHASIEAIT